MKMRFKFRVKSALQFIAFAFYPKTTLIACAVFSAVVIAVLGVVMSFIPHDSNWYNLVFALTTGAAGSFFVSFIVELANNYRHNKLAWHELQDYYSIVTDYESTKQVLMQHYPSQRAEKRAHDEFAAAGGMEELNEEDRPKDLMQATWEQIPKIIPVLKKTLNEKKAFLSDSEIIELKNIMADFSEIRSELKTLIMLSPLLHNVLNHPDEEILSNYYSKNVLDDMPEWIRHHIASNESQASMERLIDAILDDDFLLTYFMRDYDISQHGLDSYQSPFNEEDYEPEEFDADDYDFSDPEDEEEFKALHNEQGRILIEENKSFVSWHISRCCSDMAESIDTLERAILKQPYYSMHLEFDRSAEEASLDDPISSITYESEKKRLEKLLQKQETDH